MKSYVAYYRVSTQKQGASGLGLEAQRRIVENTAKNGLVIAEYTDIESGRKNDRPELLKALAHCRQVGATLLIAKLDRLSRNVAFIANLMESGVDFIAGDMPTANKFTLHIFAALAEQEREMISARTKEALKAYKARGGVLGKPENLTDEARARGTLARIHNARVNDHNRKAAAMIAPLREKGLSFGKIADELNRLGFTARRGGKFSAEQVKRLGVVAQETVKT
jgi:DNA invertase Pin-like site-specific DNA recombinase